MRYKKIKKSTSELRKFGLIMSVPLAIIYGLMAWKGRSAAPYFLSLTLFFIASGILIPQILAPIEKVWMALARVLSVVMTYVILTLTFYLVITPMGLLVRILGKDLLKLKFKTDEPSYWIKVDPEGPCSHPEKPY